MNTIDGRPYVPLIDYIPTIWPVGVKQTPKQKRRWRAVWREIRKKMEAEKPLYQKMMAPATPPHFNVVAMKPRRQGVDNFYIQGCVTGRTVSSHPPFIVIDDPQEKQG